MMTSLAGSLRAELRRLLLWPAAWVLGGVWVLLNLTFAYVFPYLTFRNGSAIGPNGDPAAPLELILPGRVPVAMVAGMPMFGGALVLILGALAVGSGYGWGTWKTVLTTGPRRRVALTGTLLALGVVMAAMTLLTLIVDLGASCLIAVAENRAIVGPGVTDVLKGLASTLLISLMWTVGGALIGALARGPALAVGLGLVWSLVLENLLRGVAAVLDPLRALTDWLPGTVAGSVAAAVGALPPSDPSGTPGVNTIHDGRTAVVVLIGFVLAFGAAMVGLVSRRDLSS